MANAERGEVELVTETKTYTLVLSMNAVCEMQTRTGKTYGELVRSLKGLDFLALRDILWMTLKKYHAKEFPKADIVGDLIDGLDFGAKTAVETLTQLFKVNDQRGKEPASPKDPLPAQV